eukprot:UN25155
MGVHCENQSLCDPNPCLHGTCFNNEDAYVCSCDLGWTGDDCDIENVNPCKGNSVCGEHGTCYPRGLDHECWCEDYYIGESCETEITCDPNPCLNNGRCSINAAKDGTECTCGVGFEGETCEIEDLCNPNPCQNEGRCDEGTCTCASQYYGENCENVYADCPAGRYEMDDGTMVDYRSAVSHGSNIQIDCAQSVAGYEGTMVLRCDNGTMRPTQQKCTVSEEEPMYATFGMEFEGLTKEEFQE